MTSSDPCRAMKLNSLSYIFHLFGWLVVLLVYHDLDLVSENRPDRDHTLAIDVVICLFDSFREAVQELLELHRGKRQLVTVEGYCTPYKRRELKQSFDGCKVLESSRRKKLKSERREREEEEEEDILTSKG